MNSLLSESFRKRTPNTSGTSRTLLISKYSHLKNIKYCKYDEVLKSKFSGWDVVIERAITQISQFWFALKLKPNSLKLNKLVNCLENVVVKIEVLDTYGLIKM